MRTLFDSVVDGIVEQIDPICEQIEALPLDQRVEALNRIRAKLHEVSPFKSEPVDCVQWVPADSVEGNEYNPNRVAPPEMRLLKVSIDKSGYTQPVVAWLKKHLPITPGQNGHYKYEVVDGFHRTRVGREYKSIRERLHGYLPVTVIRSGREDEASRMEATIQHNRARGVHGVRPMADLVADLIKLGRTDDEIAHELGMDADEVLRFKQNKGLPELFKNHEYSNAWE